MIESTWRNPAARSCRSASRRSAVRGSKLILALRNSDGFGTAFVLLASLSRTLFHPHAAGCGRPIQNFAAINHRGRTFLLLQSGQPRVHTLPFRWRVRIPRARLNCSARHADGSRMCSPHGLCAPEFTRHLELTGSSRILEQSTARPRGKAAEIRKAPTPIIRK